MLKRDTGAASETEDSAEAERRKDGGTHAEDMLKLEKGNKTLETETLGSDS